MSYYDILGVPPSASAEEIRLAYRRVAFDLHPDRSASAAPTPHREELLRMANEAFAVLGTPEKRTEYDALHGPFMAPQSQPPGEHTQGADSIIALTVASVLPVLICASIRLSPESSDLVQSIFFSWATAIALLLSSRVFLALPLRHFYWAVLAAGLGLGAAIFHPGAELNDFLFFLKTTLVALGAASAAHVVGQKLEARTNQGVATALTLTAAVVFAHILAQGLGVADPDGSLAPYFSTDRTLAQLDTDTLPENLAATLAAQWAALGAILGSLAQRFSFKLKIPQG